MSTCETCGGYGVVRSGRMTPEADCDLDTCPTCGGDSEPDDGPELDPDAALESDTPMATADDDGEPADIDSDAGFDPYAGGPEDDGYDTYGDDCGDY